MLTTILLLSISTSSPAVCSSVNIFLNANGYKNLKHRDMICSRIVVTANDFGVDPYLAAAVAFEESKFSFRTSSAGAIGPMQILPKYWCPGKKAKGCNTIYHGVRALYENKNPCIKYNARNRCIKRVAVDTFSQLFTYACGGQDLPECAAYAERVLEIRKALMDVYVGDPAPYPQP